MGKAKANVACDACGEEIWACGWVAYEDGEKRVLCDECGPMFPDRREIRICDRCGAVMDRGFCSEDADHICEACFEPWMDEACPGGWRANEHGDDKSWDGGNYDELVDGKCVDTGIYWTEWN